MKQNRRRFLKYSGAATANIGLVNAVKAGSEIVTETRFIEFGFEVNILSNDNVREKLLERRIDNPIHHTVDNNSDHLYLFKDIPGNIMSISQGRRPLMHFGGYRPVTGQALRREIPYLPLNSGKAFRSTVGVRLEDNFQLSNASISDIQSGIGVRINGNDLAVGDNKNKSIDLDTITVTCKTRERTSTEGLDHLPAHERGKRIQYGTEEVKIRPQFKVANHGSLEVIDARDRRTM